MVATLSWLLSKVRALTDRRGRERDLDAELAFHLDEDAAEHAAAGMPADEARRAARLQFGNPAVVREDARAVWAWGAVERVIQDVRFAARVLVRQPAFTAAALVTLALIIGGTTAVFTLVNGVLLRPLPYPASDRLAFVRANDPDGWTSLAIPEVDALQRALSSVEAWGLYRPGHVTTLDRDSDAPVAVQDMRITPDLFPLLGFRVVLGRPPLAGDTKDATPEVVVIGHDLWQTRFGGTRDVIGRSLELEAGRPPVTIVGVAEPGADVPANWLKMPIVWRPVREGEYTDRTRGFAVLARLREGRTIQSARSEIAARSPGAAPGAARPVDVVRLVDHLAGDNQQVLWVFFGAVSCVLLIGVANLVSLQLVRNAGRTREFGVRSALGAGQWRLVRQLVVESLLIGAAGGVAGLAAATLAVGLITSALPPTFPRREEIAIDGSVWMFAAALSIAVGVVIGVLPAFGAVRRNLAARLTDTSRGMTLGRQRTGLQRLLIGGETAAALVLLVGAGLLIHSLGRLLGEDAGMREANLWVVRGTLPDRYQDGAARAYWTEALRQMRARPDVESATLVINDTGPLGGGDIRLGGIGATGAASSPHEGLSLSHRVVGSEYFSTLGIPVLEGRPILESDTPDGERVVVLNRSAAAALWPNEHAIGQRIQFGRRPMRVIGLVPDFKLTQLTGDVTPQMYTPIGQLPSFANTSAMLVRVKPGARAFADRSRAILLNLESKLEEVDVSTMAQVRWKLVAAERFRTTVLTVFAATALFLALVGIFGLVSYAVTQRYREIGLRLALGATLAQVVRLMVRQALVPAALGIAAGFAGAVVAGRVLASFLFEIEPTDPATLMSAVGLLAAAAVGASLVPALRCARVSPADVLRHE